MNLQNILAQILDPVQKFKYCLVFRQTWSHNYQDYNQRN